MRTAALILLLAAPLAAQQGSIEGVVLNQASGQPLPGVHVRLFAGLVIETAAQAYGANTDANGQFSVAAMPPGVYTVELERSGFLQVPGNGFMHHTEMELRPGEHLAGRQLAMSPLILIAGRIVNQYGDPVPGVQVQVSAEAVRPNVVDGGLIGPYGIRTTDERGRFRLFAAPGKYYIVARAPLSLNSMGPAETRTDGTSDLVYAITYYPDSLDAGSATMVEVKPGSELSGLEIHLRSGAARRNLTVSGVVTGIPAGCQATVAYEYGESPGHFSSGNTGGRAGAGGSFSFDNLAPGYMRLLARCSSGDTELQSDVVDIHLEPPGATGVQLALTPGGVVTGALEIVGDGPSTGPAGKLAVRLSPMGIGFSTPGPARQLSGPVDQDGAFRIVGVTPDRFSLSVDAMPENAYVKAILLDNASVTDRTLDFSRGVRGPRLKVTVSRHGAQISGDVRAADGGPLLNPRVMVCLVSEPNQTGPNRLGVPVIEGHYTLKSVPPGKYKICAVDPFRTPLAGGSIGEPCNGLLAAAETLEVSEGARVTKDLKALAQEAPNAQPKK